MMHRFSTFHTTLMALLLGAAFVLAGCPNGTSAQCDEGFVLNEDGECVPEEEDLSCELWQENCCERNRNPGDRRGQRDCFGLDTGDHIAVCDRQPDQALGMCILLCNTHADCDEFYPERCDGGACVCDGGYCSVPACSADIDCGGEGLCIGGACTDGVADPDGCVIAPSPVYTRQGESIHLRAFATRGDDYVVPAAGFSWSSADGDVASVDSDSGLVTGGTAESSTVITATVAGASCTVDVTNFAALLPTEGRVLVLDEISREAVVGATVVIDDAVLADDVTTDGAGVATFTAPAGAYDIHVFSDADAEAPNGRAYVSIIGTTEADVIVYLPRNATESVGGFRGTMREEDFAHISNDTVHVALAGLSIPGNFIDIDLTILIGELIDTHVEFGSLIDDEIPLPSGLVLGIGEQFFKDWYAPLGVPGKRTGWILGGNLSIPDVTQVLGPVLSGGTDDIPIGSLVGALLPLFDSFYSGVKPGIDVAEGTRPETWPPTNDETFPNVSMSLDKPLQLKGIVDVPTLPQLGGNYVDGAIVLGGVMVAGQGLVPLGLTAGVDQDDPDVDEANGQVNSHGTADDPSVGPGQLGLRIAPQHGGVEGSEYVVLSLALGFSDLMDDGGRNPLSGYVTTFDRLQFEDSISFGASSYMGFAEDATYDATTRTFSPAAVSDANLYRASMTAPGGRAWVVYHGGTGPIELVDPDDFGFEDRTSGTINAQAIRTRGSVGLNDLFGFNGVNLDALVDVLHGFSTIAALDAE